MLIASLKSIHEIPLGPGKRPNVSNREFRLRCQPEELIMILIISDVGIRTIILDSRNLTASPNCLSARWIQVGIEHSSPFAATSDFGKPFAQPLRCNRERENAEPLTRRVS